MCQKKVKVFPQSVKKPKNTPAYYQCLLNESLSGFRGQRITQACQNCKVNSADLAKARNQEIENLMLAYQQLGQSLKNLLTPLAND
jgi:hypothetical protein